MSRRVLPCDQAQAVQIPTVPCSPMRRSAMTIPCPRSITRAALSGLLRAKASDHGVLVHFGKRVTAADIGQDGTVTATFGDGTRATGDLLIGADGIHSPVRTLIDPAAPAPRDTGLTIACGYARHPAARARWILRGVLDVLRQPRVLRLRGRPG